MSPIAFVTCLTLPEPDPDEQLLLEACREAGIEAELAAWDDPCVEWSRFRCLVLRSCWNYHVDPDRFRSWLRHASPVTRVVNGVDLVCWNLDKRYLGELAAEGVPIVPTRFLGNPADVCSAIVESGWERFVLKPTISAGSYMTRSFLRDEIEEAVQFARGFGSAPFMAQQFVPSVEGEGEIALVHVDGELTHGVVKHARFEGQDESVSEAFEPTQEQAQAAELVMSLVDHSWLYARVDLMQDEHGKWLLSELELIEPSLFFLQHPPALSRFVAALGRL